MERQPEWHDVVVIGAGSSGLAAAHDLAKRGIDFVVLEANERVGNNWRRRYDSVDMYSPAKYDVLPGLPMPLPGHTYPADTRWRTTSSRASRIPGRVSTCMRRAAR